MASSSSKMTQIYVGAGVLAVLGGALYLQNRRDAATTNTTFTRGSTSSAPQIKIVPEEITKITIKAKDKPEFVVEKKGDAWTMTTPVAGAKANKSTIDDIINSLKGVTFKDPIAKGASNYASYELEEGKGVHVVASKDGTPVIDLWLGSQKSRGQMARLGSDDQIWSVSGVSGWTFDKAPKDVRDKKVWDVPRESVTEIDLHSAKGSFTFARHEPPPAPAAADGGVADDTGAADVGEADAGAPTKDAGKGKAQAAPANPSWTATLDGKPIANLDIVRVDDLLNAFTVGGVLNADDFGDGKSDAETGLTGPDATTITFKTKEGGAHKIVIGKADGTRRFARREGDSTIFILTETPSAWGEAGLDKVTPPPASADAGAGGSDGGPGLAVPGLPPSRTGLVGHGEGSKHGEK